MKAKNISSKKSPKAPLARLNDSELGAASGGRMRIPGGRVPTVLLDDGINILTTDPSRSNVIITIV